MIKTALITGASGGIGAASCKLFKSKGWRVIGLDKFSASHNECDHFITCDLETLIDECDGVFSERMDEIDRHLGGLKLELLVNNAALQVCKKFDDLTIHDFQTTFAINVFAPFQLTKTILDRYSGSSIRVINIGSIHATLSKTGFMAYASSKSALRSLTSSLAVELGDRASFCLIEPAAINTEMLRSGFQDNEEFLESLMAIHPCGSIGEASDIAEMVFFLASMKTNFINGSIFSIDGGIRGVLSDLND